MEVVAISAINKKNSHVLSLDSLRGIAALLVCGGHYLQHLGLERYFPSHQAVILFFVLSGYVLSLSLGKSIQTFLYPRFIIKRIFRLYPAYYFAIIFTTIFVTGLSVVNFHYVCNWFLLVTDIGNLFSSIKMIDRPQIGHPIDSVTWSLTYEMIISAFFPFLYLFFYRVVAGNLLRSILAFCYVFFGFLVFIYYKIAIYSVVYYSVYFVIGMYVASNIRNLKFLSSYIFIIFGVFLFFNNSLICLLGFQINNIYCIDIYSSMGAVLLIIACEHNSWLINVMKNKIIYFYGRISYSFYLLHGPMLYIAFKFLNSWNILLLLATSFICASVISYFSFIYIEQPMMTLAAFINSSKRKGC
ncbi:MAG: acyltransferase [Proteobacteria bacterium]|nr:MAG: acyltransferase [Pseudomonadota bacterium]